MATLSTSTLRTRRRSSLIHLMNIEHTDTCTSLIQVGTNEGLPFAEITLPTTSSTWYRGQPVEIEWNVVDTNIETIRIELIDYRTGGITIIATDAINNGIFEYKRVPWGTPTGEKYFLRFTCCNDTKRYVTTEFFHVESEVDIIGL